jgi:hypothetical protein
MHVNAAVADARRDEAIELTRAVRRRMNQLRAQRADITSRRADILAQRAGLMRQMAKLRQAVQSQHLAGIANLRHLDRARQMAALDVSFVWLRYVELGGNASFTRVQKALEGFGLVTVSDFNLLALAINESFAEMGLGHPLDYMAVRRVASTSEP